MHLELTSKNILSSFLLDQYILHVDVNFVCNYLDLVLQSWSLLQYDAVK